MAEPETNEQQANADEPAVDDTATSLGDQLAAAIAERDSHREQWLRSEAELDNFRKRVRREAEEARKYEAMSLARGLLPGLDNLSRAIEAAETSGNIDELVAGVRMISEQFAGVLTSHGLEPIAAVGEAFDPNLHEALQQVPSAEHPPMTVVQEVERGYTLHDRVVRPAKVIVSSGPPPESEDAQPTDA